MSYFDLAWNRYRRSEAAPWAVECILLERILLGGRPQIRVVARLASIVEDEIESVHGRDEFWRSAGRKLGKLRRLDGRDRDRSRP